MTPTRAALVATPLGPMLALADAAHLLRLTFLDGARAAPVPDLPGGGRVLEDTAAQLAEYFHGRRTAFRLPLHPRGTAFQHRVWDALRATPHGTTTTYAALAAAIGSPGAARAVGAANARNPLHVVVPCHRVLAADGALAGYAGGLARKRALLDLERTAATASNG